MSPSDSRADDAFGFGVAISGDTVLVGANDGTVLPGVEAGAAYVFNRVGVAWSEQAKLTPADGAPHDNFGYSVALSGDTAVVGMPGDDVGAAVEQGSVRVFTRQGAVWTEQARLRRPMDDPETNSGNPPRSPVTSWSPARTTPPSA